MIKNLIFDFGNVVVRFDPYYMASCVTENEDDRRILVESVFNPITFELTDRGFISLEKHIVMVLPHVPEHLKEKAVELLRDWYKYLPVYDGMENLLSEVKKAGYKIYILSNINSHFKNNADKVDILKMFDGTVFSSEIKFIKPEPEIYEYLLHKYALQAHECVFIDDREVNVEGAENSGIKGYHFKTADALKEYINNTQEFAYKI